jgi:hypothetical protein
LVFAAAAESSSCFARAASLVNWSDIAIACTPFSGVGESLGFSAVGSGTSPGMMAIRSGRRFSRMTAFGSSSTGLAVE